MSFNSNLGVSHLEEVSDTLGTRHTGRILGGFEFEILGNLVFGVQIFLLIILDPFGIPLR